MMSTQGSRIENAVFCFLSVFMASFLFYYLGQYNFSFDFHKNVIKNHNTQKNVSWNVNGIHSDTMAQASPSNKFVHNHTRGAYHMYGI